MAEQVDTEQRSEIAFAALLPEITAVGDDEILPLNIDVVNAVTLVLGVLPELRALREEIKAELTRFDIARFDKLEQYALALDHADALYRRTLPDKATIAELGAELAATRDRLYTDAMWLASYDLVDPAQLKDCKKANGYRAAATDVRNLVAVLKERWPKIEGKLPVTLTALNQAANRAVELLAAVGVREQGPVTTGETARLRQKIFTLFVAAYDDARRAVNYLRADKEEADSIVPSLWTQRGAGRPRTNPPEPDDEQQPPQHPADVAAQSRSNVDVPINNPAGLPITKPFIDN